MSALMTFSASPGGAAELAAGGIDGALRRWSTAGEAGVAASLRDRNVEPWLPRAEGVPARPDPQPADAVEYAGGPTRRRSPPRPTPAAARESSP